MRLFSEKVTPTFTNSDLNILTVRDYNEVFFDVFEFEINGNKVIAERVDTYKGMPVVSIPTEVDGREGEYPFVLECGEPGILFNRKNTLIQSNQQEPIIESLEIDTGDTLEELLFENRDEILNEIRKTKQSAKLYIEQLKKQKLIEIDQYNTEKSKILTKEVEKMKKSLIEDFLQLTETVRSDLHESRDKDRVELTKKISRSIKKISQLVEEKAEAAEHKLEEQLNETIKQLLLREVALEQKSNKQLIENKTQEISNLLKQEVDSHKQSLKNIVDSAINILESNQVELNDKIEKQSNRALSRIGNVKTTLEQSLDRTKDTFKQATTHLEEQLTEAQQRIHKLYDKKFKDVEKQIDGISQESREYVLSCIEESKRVLLEEINNIKVDVPNIIIEQKKGSQVVDLKGIKAELEKIIGTRFSNEMAALKRLIELSSGGGSVAQQFAAGGTMNGTLNVTGQILSGGVDISTLFGTGSGGGGGGGGSDVSALSGNWQSTYTTVQANSATWSNNDYLPLSGGTITGSLSVTDSLSAKDIYTQTLLFDTTQNITPQTGQLTWNQDENTLNLGLNNDVSLQIGEETIINVKAAEDIKNGQCVYASGAVGSGSGNIEVSLYKSQFGFTSEIYFLGIATQDINSGDFGYVTTFGKVRSVLVSDTRATDDPQYALPTNDGWEIGTVLYPSVTDVGKYTQTRPSAPHRALAVVMIIGKNGNQRIFYVRSETGYDMEDLHNVQITNPQNGQFLTYNTGLSSWSNITLPQYLPLSGGLITGNLAVSGSVNTRALYTSSDSFPDYSKSTIYKDSLTVGSNTSPTFTLETDLSLSNCKFFITYTSQDKRSVVEAFVMRYNNTCQINVYSLIHSDNNNPLITDVSCELVANNLNIISNVSQDCRAIFNGIATYVDESVPVFTTEDMNYVFETEQGSGILFAQEE
jgi:hypothetical protein